MSTAFFQITLKLFLLRERNERLEFLVLRDRKSQWGDLPGGRLEKGEILKPLNVALNREIREELGESVSIRVDKEPFFIFGTVMADGGHEALGIAYTGTLESGEVELSDEHDLMEWVDVKTYDPSPLFHGHMRDAVIRFQTIQNNEKQ